MARNHKDLEDEIKNNKEKESLTEELKESSPHKEKEIEYLKDEIEKNKEKIASLEEKLRESRGNEKRLQDMIEALEKKNQNLNERLQEMEVKIEKLVKSNAQGESVLIIMQIGTKIQRNMCKYVLGKYFNEDSFYSFKEIDKYIKEDLKHTDEQEAARQRLKELRKKISWNQRLVKSLKNLNDLRIGTAHPDLSSENIQNATDFLKEEKMLTEGMIHNINKLKEQWETSEDLIQTSSTEGQDQRHEPTTRQKHVTYTRKATGELVNPLPPKRARKGQTSSAEERDQGNVPTTRQKNGTYASKAISKRANTPPPKCDRGSRPMQFI